MHFYTQCGPKVLGLMFLKIERHMRKTYTFFIQNKLHWHIYIYIYIYIYTLLTSFSTWGTENSLVEINLVSRGGSDKGL
jgi:Uri superfamily endonuclease